MCSNIGMSEDRPFNRGDEAEPAAPAAGDQESDRIDEQAQDVVVSGIPLPEDFDRAALPYAYTMDSIDRPEIVVGLVGALGTRLEVAELALTAALAQVSYSCTTVRVSSLISETNLPFDGPRKKAKTTVDRLMDLGDELRIGVNHGGVAAALTVSRISNERAEQRPADFMGPNERQSHATMVRSLKHPEEVRLLRAVYGPRFVLVGIWSPQDEREREVDHRLTENHPEKDEHWRAKHVGRLLQRDEKDARSKLGQRVRDTFELADAYLSLQMGVDITDQANRLIRLLLGAPFETPNWEEQAMFQASGARLRSADAGRQVGAVVVDADCELLVTGTNEVPKAGGGQYWRTDDKDHRDFSIGYDANHRIKQDLVVDVLRSLKKDGGWLRKSKQILGVEQLTREAVYGPLASSRISDLLEFGRIAHAEMAAICTAARRGTPLRSGVMLTTTYPCHECARLIIAAGISRVIYIDPYPKSKVPEMYRYEVSDDGSRPQDKVNFDPFVGVAPRLYPAVFSMFGRSRDRYSGDFGTWEPATSQPRLVVDAEATYPIQRMEDAVSEQLVTDLEGLGWVAPVVGLD